MSPPGDATRALVVIPALNEGSRIARVIDGLRRAAADLDVLVVDDGSSDDTATRARAAGARVVSHPFNLGYGAALQTGYKHALRAHYAHLVQMDGDGQHDPADVPRLVAPLRAGAADVVIGSRFMVASGYHMGAARAVGRTFFQRLLVACGGPRVTDPTSGFQALARAAFTFCCADFYPSDFPDVDVLLLLHRRGLRIVEVPVTMAPNPPGHVPMHAGVRAVYYPYKMLLSTLRSAFAPRKETS
ncbi:MAG: glycosyltransferase family 2 protein [Deltaproteobacteria bacterium]|nr:glycosyltransferase family 2 protein [Deltaproteobacteria bacterium]